MPWWSWLLIWSGLVLALLGMLAFFAVVLFRKFMAMSGELGVLLEHADKLAAASDAVREAPARRPAIFADRSELEYEVERLRRERLIRGQLRKDARIRRAKMIRSTSPN